MRRLASWLWSKRSTGVFLGAALFSAAELVRITSVAIDLAPLTHDERRARLMGDFYVSIRELRRTLAERVPLTLVLDGDRAIDRAVFAVYYLYPRPVRMYFGGVPPGAPRTMRVVSSRGALRRTVVRDPAPGHSEYRSFIVPFVAAETFADVYSTEAAFFAESETEITLTLMPAGEKRRYTLAAATPLVFGDLVFETYGRLTSGWLRVDAARPVRSAFWLVNRTAFVAVPLPLMTNMPPLPQRHEGGTTLWVVNPNDTEVHATVNGRDEVLTPGALASFPAQPLSVVDADLPLLTFTSRKTADGNTLFSWPESIE